MGRELKRVPLDFDWPLDVTWKGYLNPYAYHECPACKGSGYNPETKQISDDFYDFDGRGTAWHNDITQDEVEALIEAGRLRELDSETREWKVVPRTAEEVNAANSQPRLGGLAHDGINRSILIETRAKRLGVYGHCKACGGKGELFCDEKYEKLRDEWENIDPPTGDGYQLWQTTSEGSPISPVFETLEALCEWAADNATTFGRYKAGAEEWRKMLDADFVCHKEGNMIFM